MPNVNQSTVARLILGCLLGTVLLGAVSLLNGYPLLFNDTRSYVRQPALVLKTIIKRDLVSDWPSSSDREETQKIDARSSTPNVASNVNKGVTANRSVYYGLLALIGYVCGGFWLTVAIQSFWTALVAYMLISLLTARSHFVFVTSIAITSVFSCAGFYTGYIMPDIFAPIMIISSCSLLFFYKNLTRQQLAIAVVSMTFSVLAHPSHQLILGALTALFLVWVWAAGIRDLAIGKPTALVAGCLVVGALGQFAFNKGLEIYSGEKPLLLPHIEAHLIDMGPGTAFAKNACDPNRFVVCRYAAKFPMYWETFIGNPDPEKGVFAPADFETKRRLSDEQIPFALAVLRYDPVGVISGLVRDAGRQLIMFSLKDFIVDKPAMDNYSERFPPAVAAGVDRSAVHQHAAIVSWISFFYTIVVIAAVAYLVFALARPRVVQGSLEESRNLRRVAGFLVAGIVVNGLICGILASPYDRFQARVIWLAVFAAAIMITHTVYSSRAPIKGT